MKRRGISRRSFLKGMAGGTASLAFMGVLGACSSGSAEDDTVAETAAGTSAAAESEAAGTAAEVDELEAPYGMRYAEDQTLHTVYNSEMLTLHPYVSTGGANDWTGLSNCIGSLMETSVYGTIVCDMAESYELSDDELTYTFHLRPGIKWSDYQGNVIRDVTAEDFVTGARWACDPANASGMTYNFEDLIAGANELLTGEETDMETLGFKAVDDLTLEITVQYPMPYFLSYCGGYFPVPTEYFNEMGDNYGIDNESVYYCGAYIMTTFEPQSRRVYEKDPNYWRADEVYIDRIVMTYNPEADILAPEMFKRGEVDYATINTDVLDDWMTAEDTKDMVLPAVPNLDYMYYYMFNFKPTFGEDHEPENWDLAVNNENFRQSLYWAFDRYKAEMVHDPYYPETYLTNTITPRTWCYVDGEDFVDIGDIAEITNRENWQFDESRALEYKEKAIEELTAAGAHFPVKVYMRYDPSSANTGEEVQVVKQQLEGVLGTDYISCELESGPETNFLAEVRRSGDYAFMRSRNGGTMRDPVAWTLAFEDGNTWNFMYEATGEETQALVKEYYELVDEAKAVTTQSMERYEKFAKAEAFLLNHALVIPFRCDSSGYRVARFNPLKINLGDMRYVTVRMYDEPLTTDVYEQLYADYEAEMEVAKEEAAN